jgi:serine/threonine protein kinase
MAQSDLDASANELLGTEIGPYTLVRRLGVGGMAETYVAIRRGPSGFSQRVCLKLVLPFFREDREFVELFQREARLAAKLRHSNIVGVLDYGEVAGRSYMALELVDGVDLQVLLDAESGRRLSPEYVALVGHDLAAALDHAHNPSRESDLEERSVGVIVHRDISPSNVLISRHGEIMLSDFGVAKAITGTSNKHSAVKGKIPYMSPEQLRLEPLDGRADLFGVGVVLFEALCGQRPYEGGHDPATIMLILQGQHQPLASLAPGAPPDLCAVIESLIHPNREERPESAATLIELLDPFVPAPRVRRQLGRRVAELRPTEEAIRGMPRGFEEQATAPHEDGVEPWDEKPTSGIVGAGQGQERADPVSERGHPPSESIETHITETLPKRRGNRALAAALLAFALLVAGVLFWQGRRDAELDAGTEANELTVEEPAPEEEGSTGTAESPDPVVRPDVVVPQEELAPEAPSDDSKTDPAISAPAKLTVIVYPWGSVWINGRPRGSAPLKNLSLKPGRYEVSAGQGEPTVTRTIRLRPGQQRKLKLDVTK